MGNYGIKIERQGYQAIIVINRPDKQNSFDKHMWDCLEQVIQELKSNLPRVIIITGAGDKAFSAGFDVNPENPQVANLIHAIQQQDKAPIAEFIRRIRTIIDNIVMLPVPIIAALNGFAIGGGAEIAARCDMRVMDPNAYICFSEVRLGLMPDHGGVVGLTRLLGVSKAADLILTGRKLHAEEAYRIGFANRISEPGKALEEAMSIANMIAENGPKSVRHALKAIRKSEDMSIMDALEMETNEAVDLITQGECIHGITAFLTGKKPEFPESD